MTADDDLEIRNLVSRYADAVCRRDADQWIGTWAEGCHWDLGGGRVTEGRAATLGLWTTSMARYPFVAQLVLNGIVHVDGDAATGRWYILELNHLADGTGVLHAGNYDDRYVRTPDGWRFASRAIQMFYRGALDPGTVVPLQS